MRGGDEMSNVTKVAARKMLSDVPPEKVFWCCDGKTFKNMPELAAGLKEMSDETFRYHSNETKTDFSNWVKDVIGDEELSRNLLKSTTSALAAEYVGNRVTFLKTQMKTK